MCLFLSWIGLVAADTNITVDAAGFGLKSGQDATPALRAVMEDRSYKNASAPVEERVKDLLSRMTVEEKIKQLQYNGTRRTPSRSSWSSRSAPSPREIRRP